MLLKPNMTDHVPTSFSFLIACLVTLLAYALPDTALSGEVQVYIEALTLLAKALAPVGTFAAAVFAYRRWQAERRDRQADKARIEKLEDEARAFESERVTFLAKFEDLVRVIDTREQAHNERKRQRLDEVETDLADLRGKVEALDK